MSTKRLSVKYRLISELEPYAKNARTHTAEQIKQIARSIAEFGWTNPILTDHGNGIVAGHGRVLAAKSMGMDKVPCIELGHMTPKAKRAYVLADNKLAENAGWDKELLRLELGALFEQGFALSLTGFSELELERLDAKLVGGLDPDEKAEEVPPLPDTPISAPGDLWLLGKHRLLCGDSTSEADVSYLLGQDSPHLMVTDPPYGVNYDASWRSVCGTSLQAIAPVANDDQSDWSAAWALFKGDVAYVWHSAMANGVSVALQLQAAGFDLKPQIIWVKQHFPVGRGHYHVQHESCWYGIRKGGKGHWTGSRKETTVWQIANRSAFGGQQDDANTKHSTQKPIDCMRKPILNNSKLGDTVYDPFLGSGTTLIAAEMTKRRCFGLELEPAYCDIIVQRWENYTGQKAELQRQRQAAV